MGNSAIAEGWENLLKKCLENPQNDPILPGNKRYASVLVVLAKENASSELKLILTKRTQWVESHKGEISFPGGFVERTDSDRLHTALRESEEEIGLEKSDVHVLGALNSVQTRGGVDILPWVGTMALPYDFRISAQEVERIIFLPLAQLLEEGLQSQDVVVEKKVLQTPGLKVDREIVWGATARVLSDLRQRYLSFLTKN